MIGDGGGTLIGDGGGTLRSIASIVAAGGGNVVSNDGAGLVGNDGASLARLSNLIGQDLAGMLNKSMLIGDGGGTLIGDGGGTLINRGGSGLVGAGGSTLVGAGGSTLVGQSGADFAMARMAAVANAVPTTNSMRATGQTNLAELNTTPAQAYLNALATIGGADQTKALALIKQAKDGKQPFTVAQIQEAHDINALVDKIITPVQAQRLNAQAQVEVARDEIKVAVTMTAAVNVGLSRDDPKVVAALNKMMSGGVMSDAETNLVSNAFSRVSTALPPADQKRVAEIVTGEVKKANVVAGQRDFKLAADQKAAVDRVLIVATSAANSDADRRQLAEMRTLSDRAASGTGLNREETVKLARHVAAVTERYPEVARQSGLNAVADITKNRATRHHFASRTTDGTAADRPDSPRRANTAATPAGTSPLRANAPATPTLTGNRVQDSIRLGATPVPTPAALPTASRDTRPDNAPGMRRGPGAANAPALPAAPPAPTQMAAPTPTIPGAPKGPPGGRRDERGSPSAKMTPPAAPTATAVRPGTPPVAAAPKAAAVSAAPKTAAPAAPKAPVVAAPRPAAPPAPRMCAGKPC